MESKAIEALQSALERTGSKGYFHLETVDNPGWNIEARGLSSTIFHPAVRGGDTAWKWWIVSVHDGHYRGSGGAYQLSFLVRALNHYLSHEPHEISVAPTEIWTQTPNDRLDLIHWLEDWYAEQCDGDWEHGRGMWLTYTPESGWSVRVSLDLTDASGQTYQAQSIRNSKDDWYSTKVVNDEFVASASIERLCDVLERLQHWILSCDRHHLSTYDGQALGIVHFVQPSLSDMPKVLCPICRTYPWQSASEQPMLCCYNCGAKLHNQKILSANADRTKETLKQLEAPPDLNIVQADVSASIVSFRDYLVNSWKLVTNLTAYDGPVPQHELILAWQQASWELLVERRLLGEFLHLCSFHPLDLRFRVSEQNKKPVYQVVSRHKRPDTRAFELVDKGYSIPFDRSLRLRFFVSFNTEGELQTTPPFDYACLIDDGAPEERCSFIMPLEDLSFYIEPFS